MKTKNTQEVTNKEVTNKELTEIINIHLAIIDNYQDLHRVRVLSDAEQAELQNSALTVLSELNQTATGAVLAELSLTINKVYAGYYSIERKNTLTDAEENLYALLVVTCYTDKCCGGSVSKELSMANFVVNELAKISEQYDQSNPDIIALNAELEEARLRFGDFRPKVSGLDMALDKANEQERKAIMTILVCIESFGINPDNWPETAKLSTKEPFLILRTSDNISIQRWISLCLMQDDNGQVW